MVKTVQRRTRDAFILVLLVPAIFGVLTLGLVDKNEQDLRWVLHSQDVLRSLNRLVAHAYQAESNQRGFLLTGEPSLLDRYRSYTSQEWAELRRFGHLTADNPIQQAYASQLLTLWTKRANAMQAVLDMRKQEPFTPKMTDLFRQGSVLMDQMSGIAADMASEEYGLLKARSIRQHATAVALRWLFAVEFVINLLLLYWAYRLIRNYGLARDRAEFEIRLVNAELEKRVADRTSELEAANENLLRSNEDLARFAYVASHDLQEPLRTVGSYAGLLARRYEGKLDAQADKYIGFIVSGAKRMQNMVQDLLAYARTGTQQLTFQSVEMKQVVHIAEQNLRVAIAETRARLVCDNLPTIEADEGKLAMVLQNLVSNAIKFRHPERPPVIEITAGRSGSEWVFSVRDNGIGFDAQYAERIFVIFQRLHRVGEYAGTGIGLAICRRVIEGHGGRIWAESVPGEGSKFSFSIPVHPQKPAPSAEFAPALLAASQSQDDENTSTQKG